jgi:glycosyltransferase involved in cell wall biosynthesis
VANALSVYARIPHDHIRVIYNPIEISQIIEKALMCADHSWISGKTTPIALAVGRLCKDKNFNTLLKASTILRNRKTIRFIILGDGEERTELTNTINENKLDSIVSMPGYKPNPYPYMRNADVFVLSSKYEGFPNVLVEAMACEVPIVSTDCPSGPAEILDGGKYGKLVPVGDAEAVAEAIEATLESPVNRNLLKQRAENYSIDKIITQYIDTLFF